MPIVENRFIENINNGDIQTNDDIIDKYFGYILETLEIGKGVSFQIFNNI